MPILAAAALYLAHLTLALTLATRADAKAATTCAQRGGHWSLHADSTQRADSLGIALPSEHEHLPIPGCIDSTPRVIHIPTETTQELSTLLENRSQLEAIAND